MRYYQILEAKATYPRSYALGKTFDLYHNPDMDEFMKVFQDSNFVLRALIDEDGELWVWNADHALHSEVDIVAGTAGTLGFIIFHNHIDAQQGNKKLLRQALNRNDTLKRLKINRMRMT